MIARLQSTTDQLLTFFLWRAVNCMESVKKTEYCHKCQFHDDK